ncbi:MAG TPA: phosphatidylglycerophosphatase A [Desulfonatronum sp.]|nr:phosphatidylglycerophosphatase A [Desulfonatronum sp.]
MDSGTLFHARTDFLASSIATLGPLGRLPKAPGSWGSLGAVLAAPWLFLPFSTPIRVLILLLVLTSGTWAAGRMEKLLNRKDPGCVVVDELCGQWLTFLPFASLGHWQLVAGFALFRIFDIFKPWPVRLAEQRIHGGLGVMLDDCVAALYAALALWAVISFCS